LWRLIIGELAFFLLVFELVCEFFVLLEEGGFVVHDLGEFEFLVFVGVL
jgi:hypothetical protein